MMSILPKSGFEVLHPSPDQLAVVAHPMYWLLLLTVLSAVVGIYLGILGLKKGSNSTLVLGLFLVLAGVFFSSLALSRGQAVFDKAKGTVTFDRVGVLFRSWHSTFPLSDVRNATVQTMGGGSYHFMVIFKNGGVEDIMGSSGASGQYRAADAVNEFLGVAR
jgi:hypothetical protein